MQGLHYGRSYKWATSDTGYTNYLWLVSLFHDGVYKFLGTFQSPVSKAAAPTHLIQPEGQLPPPLLQPQQEVPLLWPDLSGTYNEIQKSTLSPYIVYSHGSKCIGKSKWHKNEKYYITQVPEFFHPNCQMLNLRPRMCLDNLDVQAPLRRLSVNFKVALILVLIMLV